MQRLFKMTDDGLLCIEMDVVDGLLAVREGRWGEALRESRQAAGDATTVIADLVRRHLDDGYALELQPDPVASRFFHDELLDLLVSEFKVQRGAASDQLLEDVEAVYGQKAPRELRHLLQLRGGNTLGWCNFCEWRIWANDLLPIDRTAGNTFEQLVGHYPAAIMPVMADLVPLGTAGNGDGYYAAIEPTQPNNTVVWMHDHETGELSPFADSISSLAALNRLYAVDAGRVRSDDVLNELHAGMKRLATRVAPSWHYRKVVEKAKVTPSFDHQAPTRIYWFRSNWIVKLLEGDMRQAAAFFKPLEKLHREQMIWTKAKPARMTPARALYWLFTLYFFDKPELPDAIQCFASSPSQLVRDAAAFFLEVANGRTHLHKLDLAETRRRFLELGLDPAVAAQRREREAVAAAKAESERAAQREAATNWAQGKNASAIAAEMWRRLDEPMYVRGLGVALAARSTSAATALRRARLIMNRSNWQDALAALAASRSAEERAFIAYALTGVTPWTAPELVAALEASEKAAVVAASGLVGKLRLWVRATYGKDDAIRALGALGLLSAETAEQLVTRFFWTDDDERRDRDDDEDDDDNEDGAPAVVESAFGAVAALSAGEGVTAAAHDHDETEDDQDSPAEVDDAAADDGDADSDADSDSDADEDDEADSSDDVEDDDEAEAAVDESHANERDANEGDANEDDVEEEEDSDNSDEAAAAETARADRRTALLRKAAESDPDDSEATVELDDENPLVETARFLLSMTNKAPLRAAFEALAETGDTRAVATLRRVISDGPAVLAAPALIAMARLPSDEVRSFLEAQLEGPNRRAALYALAKRGDAGALPAIDRVLAGKTGLAHRLVYERLMREALRGHSADLEVVRTALTTVMDNAYAAAELHEVALDVLARAAPREEAIATALQFVDAEQPRVQRAARAVLRRLDQEDRITVYDVTAITNVFAENGHAGLAEALRDPWAINKDKIIAFAAEQGCLPAIASEAIAVVAGMARFRFYTHNFVRGEYKRLDAAVTALFDVDTSEVEAFLRSLAESANPLLRKPFAYADEVRDSIGAGEPKDELDVVAGKPLLEEVAAMEIGAPRFILGAPVHGLAFVRDTVVAAGGGKSAVFDGDGTLLPQSELLATGWGYDVDYHAGIDRLVIGYSHGQCVVYDGATLTKLKDLRHGGMTGVRKVKLSPNGKWLATANNDKTLRIWDAATLEQLHVHTESYDVNTVAWLDDERLAFGTDQHVGTIKRAGGEAKRIQAGGTAELQVIDGDLAVGTVAHGLAILDAVTLKLKESLPVQSVARLRFTADRRSIFVACWDGPHVGLSMWNRDTKKHRQLSSEALFAMAVDPRDGSVLVGGNSNRITVFAADGRELESTPAPGEEWGSAPPIDSAIAALRRDATGEIVVMTTNGQVLRYAPTLDRAKTALRPSFSFAGGEDFAALPDGFALAGSDAVVCAGGAGGWKRATERCERVLAFGTTIVTASGDHLGWIDATTGELLHEIDAGVTSSWIAHLLRVDDDRFIVCGYDDDRLQLWSARDRKRVAELAVDHRRDGGEHSRAYGMRVHASPRLLLASFWDYEIDVFAIEDIKLTLQRTIVLGMPYSMVALADDQRTLFAGHDHGVTAFSYPDVRPLWRWQTKRQLTTLEPLPGGRVLVGANDGCLTVVSPRTTT